MNKLIPLSLIFISSFSVFAKATRTEVFDAPIETIYQVIVDFAKYPDFVDGVKKIRIIEQSETNAKVEYSLDVIKTFQYIINTKMERPNLVEWKLDSGDLFKKNDGQWKLKSIDSSHTEVTYTLDSDFKGFVPHYIVEKLTEKNLPEMMAAFKNRSNRLKPNH